MKIVEYPILSWEPLEIRFVPEVKKKDWEKEVFSWFQAWEKERLILAKDAQSSQIPLEYYIASVESDGTVIIHIEWLCEKSLPIFENFIQTNGQNTKRLEIGDNPKSKPKIETIGMKIQFVKIPEKVIYTETRKNVHVDAFEISKYPITVGQFEKFAKATKYKTTNEQKGDYRTYHENDCLYEMSKKEKQSIAAFCVSYNDAVAYCKWANLRLPTDEEWLSASIVDWDQEYKDISLDLKEKYSNRLDILERFDSEWIDEYDMKNKTSIVRHGPHYFLKKGWGKLKYRQVCPVDFTDLVLQFRVCKK